MFIVTIGYNDYAIPDEQAQHLFNIIAEMKPIKKEGWGSKAKFSFSDEDLRLDCIKIPDHMIGLSDKQKSMMEEEGFDKKCDNIKTIEEPKIAEKKEIVISETYDSPF